MRALVLVALGLAAACRVPARGQAAASGTRKDHITATSQWVRAHAIPLATVEPGHGFDDLRALRSVIGDAKIVALGEATHGTREFFQAKHRMLEFLVEEMGFTVFAIEANLPEALDVNAYVLRGEGSAQAALSGLHFWTWDTEEVLALIEWMRRYNADPRHVEKVKFYGFDMQFTARAVAHVVAYVTDVDPQEVGRLERALHVWAIEDRRPDQAYLGLSEQQRAALEKTVRDLVATFDENEKQWSAKTSSDAWQLARQHAVVLRQAERMYANDDLFRDEAMAANVDWILDVEGEGTKAVLWAHNGHVADHPGAMGRYLRERHGRDLFIVGFAFGQGSFQALRFSRRAFRALHTGSGRAPVLRDWTVGLPKRGTVEEVLADAAIPLFLLDLRRGDRDVPAFFSQQHPVRWAGSGWTMPEPRGRRVAFGSAFDAVLYVHRTMAARPNREGQAYIRGLRRD